MKINREIISFLHTYIKTKDGDKISRQIGDTVRPF